MHNNTSRDIVENQDLEILSDKDTKGKEIPWKEKKERALVLADSYKRIGLKNKFYRVSECGNFLEFKRFIISRDSRLNKANFCKIRLCPMCIWRRQKKIYGQISKVMNKAVDEREYEYIFLTLTCKNVSGDALEDTLSLLFSSFDKMFRRARIKKSVRGWFRALEVTHNLDKSSSSYDTYNGHIHSILMVHKSYFKKASLYISQEKWTQLWKESLNVEYTPIVDVRVFKTSNKKKLSKSLAEAAKYTVKDLEYIIPDNEEGMDKYVQILDNALHGRRLVAYGGKLKEIHKELNLDDVEKGDLVNTDMDEEIREDIGYIIEKYNWHIGYRQYIKNKD